MSIEARHEIKLRKQLVDVRPASEKFGEWLGKPLHLAIVTVPTMFLGIVFPFFLPLFIFITAGMVFAHLVSTPVLPYRYPSTELDPGRKGEKKPRDRFGNGIMYMGGVNSKSPLENFKEVWLSDDDLRKHMLILGSTGSGKSETLKAIFFNALAWSSGFFIADGKADNKLPVDVYAMLRSLGRDPDMLILNFLMAGKTPEQIRLSRKRRSNTLNPFSSADADTIIQMGANLLPKVDGDAKNWQEKALALWRAMVTALCYLRDTQGRDLSVADFIDYLALNKVEELYLLGYQEAQERNGEWSYGFVGIKNYLESGGCPGYQTMKLLKKHNLISDDADAQPARGGFGGGRKGGNEQENQAHEQHAYRTSQLMPALNLLDKSFGYIFRPKYPEIDMTDVTLRNRVLVMLIPSLEKSAQEAESLGKLTIACLRVMMSKNLGSEVEGNYTDLILNKTTNSPYPYVAALDELAYYFSDGIAVMFAQARSLGICMIAAAQDLEKLTEGSRAAEAGAMMANQTNKCFMRIDDHNKTPEMIQKIIGKSRVAVKKSYLSGSTGWIRQNEVDIVDEDRVTLRQLQEFKAGEAIFAASGAARFIKSFYMGKDLDDHRPENYRINRFLQVAPPTEDEVLAMSIPKVALNDGIQRGLDLIRKLKGEEGDIQILAHVDPMIRAVREAALSINENTSSEIRAIKLYLAAKDVILAEREAIAKDELDRLEHPERVVEEVPAPTPQMVDLTSGEPAAKPEEDPDADVVDALSFLKIDNFPFKRKPAEEVLLDPPPTAPTPIAKVIDAAVQDPLDVLLASGKTLSLSQPSEEVWKPVKFGESADQPGWIDDAVEQSAEMLKTPRSIDNTVVGFTDKTMASVEKVEGVLGNSNPVEAARVLQRVVSARVTPDTQSHVEIDPNNLENYFKDIEESINS